MFGLINCCWACPCQPTSEFLQAVGAVTGLNNVVTAVMLVPLRGAAIVVMLPLGSCTVYCDGCDRLDAVVVVLSSVCPACVLLAAPAALTLPDTRPLMQVKA